HRHTADRARHPPAVNLERLECRVLLPAHVHLDPVDQIGEGGERDREPRGGVTEGREHGIRGARHPTQIGSRLLEEAELFGRRQQPVPYVVDPPGEGIDGAEGAALGDREQADAVIEVRRPGAGDLFAAAIWIGGHHRGPPSSAVGDFAEPPEPARVRTSVQARRPADGRGRAERTSYPAWAIASSALRPPATNAATANPARPPRSRARGAPRSSIDRALTTSRAINLRKPWPGRRAARFSRVHPNRSRSSCGRYTRPRARSSATSCQCSTSCSPVHTESDSAIRDGEAASRTNRTRCPTGLADRAQ